MRQFTREHLYNRVLALDTLETGLPLSERSSSKRDFKPSKHVLTFDNVLKYCVYVTERLCMHWDSETVVLLENIGKKQQ